MPVREITEGAFAGFFLAMALVNVISCGLLRSSASGMYAAIMAIMVGIELFSIPHGMYGGPALHAVLIAGYLAAVVAFAFTLLGTPRHDRNVARIAVGVLAVNVALVFAEYLWPAWAQQYYAIDQLARYALLIVLIVLGFRAIKHDVTPIPVVYLTALVGPAVGLILNDLANNSRLPDNLWLLFSFELGVIWESLFFAYAVALRNRGIQTDRDRFERLAYLDPLTGVANRRTFDETLERMWNVATRARVPVAIAMIDIDHFKRLNDTRGHQVGDECLRRVAALCSSVLRRAGDCFARYGGEEFAAILVNIDLDHAISLADGIRRTVERDGGITVSVGIAARVPDPDETAGSLLSEADEALYRAKHDGRNCVRVAAPRALTLFSTPDDPGNVRRLDRRSERS